MQNIKADTAAFRRGQDCARVKRWLVASSTVMALCTSHTAIAQVTAGTQSAQDSEAGQNASLGDIIVTAQRRSQRLQDVPIAVTAISEERLQANRVTSVLDLSGLAPNTIILPAAGGTDQPSISMRGIVAVAAAPGSDKEVSINLDGVYMAATRGTLFELPDIQRIEVLRGPQGTLFGRNATAGSISIITRDPTGKFGGRQEFTVGNYDQFRTRTSIDLPAWGPFSAYISYVHNERRGDIRNLGAGASWDRSGPGTGTGVERSPKYLGSHDTDTFFAAVRFAPSDTFETVYKFDYSHDDFTPDGVAPVAINAAGGGGSTIAGIVSTQPVGGGPWGPIVFAPSAKRPKAVNNSWTTPASIRVMGHNLTSQLQLSDDLSMKNIAAYRTTYLPLAVSQIGGIGGLVVTPDTVALLGLPASLVGQRVVDVGTNIQSRSSQVSDELQLNYRNEVANITLGGIWFHSYDRSGTPPGIRTTSALVFFPATGEVPLGNTGVSYNWATSIAAYGQAEIHILPVLDLVAGGRVTRDEKHGRFEGAGIFQSSVPGCPITSNPSGVCRTEGTYSGITVAPFTYKKTQPTYSLGVNYKPSNTLLAYAKYSTAYVSGGSVGGVAFKPERVRSWEAGLKADFLDRRLRTNLAIFDALYRDVQSAQSGRNVGRPDLSTVAITGFDERARGFELEVSALPVARLNLDASLGYTHTHLSNVAPILLASVAGTTPTTTFLQTLLPDWTANLSGQYETAPLFGNATALFRLDANWRSKMRMDANPDRGDQIPQYKVLAFAPAKWIVNARVALRHITLGPLDAEFAVWGRNITNDKSLLYPLIISFSAATSFQPARTFGADLIVKF